MDPIVVTQQPQLYLWTALLITVPAILSPILMSMLMAYFLNRYRARDRAEDVVRQDVVADRVEETRVQAAEVAARVSEVASNLDETSKSTNGKLDIIHSLVDGQVTAHMQSELNATRRELVSLQEIIELKRDTGHEPSAAALAELEVTKTRVTELQAIVDERVKAQLAALEKTKAL